MTIRTRFALAAALASVIAVVAAGVVAIGAVGSSLDELIATRIQHAASSVSGAKSSAEACARIERGAGNTDSSVSLFVDGEFRCRNGATSPSPRALGVRADSLQSRTFTTQVAGNPWRVSIRSIGSGNQLVVAESMVAAERASSSATQAILIAMIAGIVIATFAGALAAAAATGRINQLLERIRTASRDVTGIARVGHVGGRDLDAAGAAFDALLDDVRRADEAQRRLFADAAHELRTPLTSMRTNAQLLERDPSLGAEARDIAARIARQGEGVARLVSQLVDHASVGAWTSGSSSEIELAVIATAAVERARERWPDSEIELHADDSRMSVDPQLVARAIGNLIDNAVAHGSGVVRVQVAADVIAVEDEGPGFAAALGDDAFRPFVSHGGSGASGSGLGLAFVDHVARAHGGSVAIVSSQPTRVELLLGRPRS